MNSEEDEFRRIETEAKRRAAGDDDIIRMAREAGWDINDLTDVFDFGVRLERFANLVANHEREACAKTADEHMQESEGKSFGVGNAIRARGQS